MELQQPSVSDERALMEIDKLTAARRLISEAIRGHLRGDDPLSVHLSAYSACRVTADLREKLGAGRSPFDHVLKPEAKAEFWRVFYRLNSFLKHADRDPGETINIEGISGLNELALVVAIDNWQVLDGRRRHLDFWSAYFQTKFLIEHPDSVDEALGGAWLATVRAVWPTLGHDYIIELARDPEQDRGQLRILEAAFPPFEIGGA